MEQEVNGRGVQQEEGEGWVALDSCHTAVFLDINDQYHAVRRVLGETARIDYEKLVRTIKERVFQTGDDVSGVVIKGYATKVDRNSGTAGFYGALRHFGINVNTYSRYTYATWAMLMDAVEAVFSNESLKRLVIGSSADYVKALVDRVRGLGVDITIVAPQGKDTAFVSQLGVNTVWYLTEEDTFGNRSV